ncbi:serine/threonine-protein kinase [Yinghuangia seranimata]|uniref:serine/threonine-protein kinase n=1 Tax=Yinghuangia seranimata TaxID=408067 RepID=UPI00248C3C33|nr:serine/threonine-protein kinase [Yinghuangia seranimata]MDI2125545.1 serine/threonine-protein kinase [Yinghuangia seranimata]
MEYSVGTVIAGRYRLAARLGGGGMGEVWRARDQRLDVDVAAKRLVVDPHATSQERRTALAYAAKESRHAAVLRSHPNVVAVHDVVEDDSGTPWTVMDLVEGPSLAQLLAAGERFAPDSAARIGRHVARALAAAHAAGIVHRDVKPSNVMLARDGRVLVVDFGIAKHSDDTRITRTGLTVGTVEYMAPERFDGTDAPAGDIWALGATVYELLEGISPFKRDTMMATIRAIGAADPPLSDAAGWLCDPVLRMLDKTPDARPTTDEAVVMLRRDRSEAERRRGTEPARDAEPRPDGEPGDDAKPGVERPPAPRVPSVIPHRPSPETEFGDHIARALRIAESVGDPDAREGALSEIGAVAPGLIEELAPRVREECRAEWLLHLAGELTEPDLVRRLVDLAEPLMARIHDPELVDEARKDRLRVLSRFASLVADSEPETARSLMRGVETAARELPPDRKYAFVLPSLLAELGGAGRAADPYAAARLTGLAEQTALRLPKAEDREAALCWTAVEVARTDPARAAEILDRLPRDSVSRFGWEYAVKAAAEAGHRETALLIDAAGRALAAPGGAPGQTGGSRWGLGGAPATGPTGGSRWRLGAARRRITADVADTRDLAAVAVAAAAVDPARAARLVSRIADPSRRATTLAGMARAVAHNDPVQARHWAEAAWATVPDAGLDNPDTLGELARAAFPIDSDLGRMAAQQTLAHIRDGATTWTLVQAAEHIAAIDPDACEQLVKRAQTGRKALSDMQRLTMAKALVQAAATVAADYVGRARDLVRDAWQIVRRPPEVGNYVDQSWAPLRELAGTDLPLARQLIAELPGRDRDPLLVEVVADLAETAPDAAGQAAEDITDPVVRTAAQVTVALAFATQARDGARQPT